MTNEMRSFIDDLLDQTPSGRRERVRARLRVAVTEELLLRMQQLGITRAELARQLGVTRAAVTQALCGSRNMSLNLLADLAEALGVSVDVRIVPKVQTIKLVPVTRSAATPILVRAAASTAQRNPLVAPGHARAGYAPVELTLPSVH